MGCLSNGHPWSLHHPRRGPTRAQNLPKSFNETYDRIIRSIEDSGHADYVLKILRWVTYAQSPLRATELLEVTGIFVQDNASRFDKDHTLEDTTDISRICLGLVTTVVISRDRYNEGYNTLPSLARFTWEDRTEYKHDSSEYSSGDDPSLFADYVLLAHFSVKEYLVSARPSTTRFCLGKAESNDLIATSCLVYILRFEEEEWQWADLESFFPLAPYASWYWTKFALARSVRSQEQRRARLLDENNPAYRAWIRISGIDNIGSWSGGYPWDRSDNGFEKALNPLLAASWKGLSDEVVTILQASPTSINTESEYHGTALRAASHEGHLGVVIALLDAGADINAPLTGNIGGPLRAAVAWRREKIVETLLHRGADANARLTPWGNPNKGVLAQAASKGATNIVGMLLAHGADPNLIATKAALACARDQIALMLIQHGAGVISHAASFGELLRLASRHGCDTVVRTLLDNGADANAQVPGAYYGNANALQRAAKYGKIGPVKMLISKGVNVNVQGGYLGNALQAAASRGHESVADLLLASGAHVNAQGGSFQTALHAAASMGHHGIVNTRLAKCANVNGEGKESTALQCAASHGRYRTVETLLANGADVNAHAAYHPKFPRVSPAGYNAGKSALTRATEGGHLDVVELLLANGADIDGANGLMTPLEAATANGQPEIDEVLRARGAGR